MSVNTGRDWCIHVGEGVMFLEIKGEDITAQAAIGMSEAVLTTLKDETIRKVVADYRGISKDWPMEVDRIWIHLIQALPVNVDKCVALCHNPTLKLETNYIFKQVGVEDRFKAFSTDELDEASKFLGVGIRSK